MIEKSAGAGDDNIDTVAKSCFLGKHADAAEDSRTAEVTALSELVEMLADLGSQFTSRGQNQSAGFWCDATGRFFFGFAVGNDAVHYWQKKSSRFAAAGLRTGQQVTPGDSGGDGLLLNWGRSGEADAVDALLQIGVQGSKNGVGIGVVGMSFCFGSLIQCVHGALFSLIWVLVLD